MRLLLKSAYSLTPDGLMRNNLPISVAYDVAASVAFSSTKRRYNGCNRTTLETAGSARHRCLIDAIVEG